MAQVSGPLRAWAPIDYHQRIRRNECDIESMMKDARASRMTVQRVRWRAVRVLGGCLGSILLAASLTAATAQPSGRWRDSSFDDYRKHLTSLTALTQACVKARDMNTCDPTLIGPDDRVGSPNGSAPRLVRYGWLRVLFSRAEEPDHAETAPDSHRAAIPSSENTRSAPPTTSQLLIEAEARLASDLAQAGSPLASSARHDRERAIMKSVLAGREFASLKQTSETDLALEKFGDWANRLFENVDKWRAKSPWIGRALVWGFMALVGIGLTWSLLRFERRWRVRLVPQPEGRTPDPESVRDWQLLLEDARKAADAGWWREAIHFVYWAAIARLESRRMWPADRARTPREYLAMVSADDPRKTGLASLTGSFERTWYGGREAHEADFRRAESLAEGLIRARTNAEQSAVREIGAR